MLKNIDISYSRKLARSLLTLIPKSIEKGRASGKRHVRCHSRCELSERAAKTCPARSVAALLELCRDGRRQPVLRSLDRPAVAPGTGRAAAREPRCLEAVG